MFQSIIPIIRRAAGQFSVPSASHRSLVCSASLTRGFHHTSLQHDSKRSTVIEDLRQTQQEKSIAAEEQVEDLEEDWDSISAPDLENIESRWVNLKQEDQHEIMDYLLDQQELNWRTDLSAEEKKAAYFLAYGNWGPRDSAQLNLPEFIFKLMGSSLLFVVLGFSLVNHLYDKDKVAQMEASEK